MSRHFFKGRKMGLTRHFLDNYIFEYGIERACSDLNLTEEQVAGKLFDKAFKPVKDRSDYSRKEPSPKEVQISKDYPQLWRVLKISFIKFYKQNKNSKTINKKSASQYDMFMDGIIDCLIDSSDFVYTSDEDTLKYIKCAIVKALQRHEMRNYRTPLSVEFDIDSHADNITDTGIEFALFLNGYSSTEITKLTQDIHHNLNRIINKIRANHPPLQP